MSVSIISSGRQQQEKTNSFTSSYDQTPTPSHTTGASSSLAPSVHRPPSFTSQASTQAIYHYDNTGHYIDDLNVHPQAIITTPQRFVPHDTASPYGTPASVQFAAGATLGIHLSSALQRVASIRRSRPTIRRGSHSQLLSSSNESGTTEERANRLKTYASYSGLDAQYENDDAVRVKSKPPSDPSSLGKTSGTDTPTSVVE